MRVRAPAVVAAAIFMCTAWGSRAGAQYYGPNPAPALAPPPPALAPPPPALAPPPPEKKIAFGFTTLKLLYEKHIISAAEYESALRDSGETVGAKVGDSLSLVLSKFSVTLYGFAETDFIYDTTQSLAGEVPGNTQIARPGTYAANHGRFTSGIRNSRFGFRIRAPEWHGLRASANAEMDFLGTSGNAAEAATFTNPVLRARQYNLKLETPIVDLLIGQTWSLFGWQPFYFGSSVEIMGLPSQVFLRTPQLRVSKTIKTDPINIEIALAMVRSPQRDSATPEGQGGARIIVNHWTGVQTINSTGTQISPMSFAFSATVRHLALDEFKAAPVNSVELLGWGVAASAFIPIIPGRPDKKGNSLALTGEYAWGYGISDEYVGLTGGVANAVLPNPTMANPAPVYTPNIDAGLAVINADGSAELIQWETFIVGAQYTLPGLDGRMWLAANYSRSDSNNAAQHVNGAFNKVRTGEDFADGSIFGDITPAVRVGLEYAWFNDHYGDGVSATNHRVQLSAYYIF